MNSQLLHIAEAVSLQLTDGILIGQTVTGEVIERAAVATSAKQRLSVVERNCKASGSDAATKFSRYHFGLSSTR